MQALRAQPATHCAHGFCKAARRMPRISWPEALDEARCCGRSDGIRRHIE